MKIKWMRQCEFIVPAAWTYCFIDVCLSGTFLYDCMFMQECCDRAFRRVSAHGQVSCPALNFARHKQKYYIARYL